MDKQRPSAFKIEASLFRISEESDKIETSLLNILNASAEQFGVTVDDIRNHKNQEDSVRQARLAAIYIAKECDFFRLDIATEFYYPSVHPLTNDYKKVIKLLNDIDFERDVLDIKGRLHLQHPDLALTGTPSPF
ncbi:MAG: hypothetical protein OEY94_06045 [Alphaproteobacteria bacterium]|nr:hypothetical protein [Alphaproteobacteria bacterium]